MVPCLLVQCICSFCCCLYEVLIWCFQNLLLEQKGDIKTIKIADFGFAKFLDHDPSHLTSTGLGT